MNLTENTCKKKTGFVFIAPPQCPGSLDPLWEKLSNQADFFYSPSTIFLGFSN